LTPSRMPKSQCRHLHFRVSWLACLMPEVPMGLCHNVAGAMLRILCQDHAQNMLNALDSKHAHLEEIEAVVSNCTRKEGKVCIHNKAIKNAASDIVKAHLLAHLAILLLKIKTKSNPPTCTWKPPMTQLGTLAKAVDACTQEQAANLCDSMKLQHPSHNVAELQCQE